MTDVRKPSRALLTAALSGLLTTAGTACGSDSHAEGDGAPRVTASRLEPEMTLERFTEECDAQGGTVELHAHCGGVNTCQGFSYDDATHELTEHTCRALNTCSGYSCVVPTES
jgi:hypothetical protein